MFETQCMAGHRVSDECQRLPDTNHRLQSSDMFTRVKAVDKDSSAWQVVRCWSSSGVEHAVSVVVFGRQFRHTLKVDYFVWPRLRHFVRIFLLTHLHNTPDTCRTRAIDCCTCKCRRIHATTSYGNQLQQQVAATIVPAFIVLRLSL